jgi:hypothetical protein
VYLLSLVPGVSLGLSAMKAFMFDSRRRGFSSDLERVLLRVIKESQDVNMPWAQRRTLMDRMRYNLLRDAGRASQSGNADVVAQVESNALRRENLGTTAAIFKESLEQVALDRRVVSENRELTRELERVLQENEALRARVRDAERTVGRRRQDR